MRVGLRLWVRVRVRVKVRARVQVVAQAEGAQRGAVGVGEHGERHLRLHPVLDRLPPGLVDVAVVGGDHGDGLQPELCGAGSLRSAVHPGEGRVLTNPLLWVVSREAGVGAEGWSGLGRERVGRALKAH